MTRISSPTRGPSTSAARRIRMPASAVAARISASAPTWRAREISVAFEELRRQMPDIQATEEPARLLSPFIHGIKRLPVSWTTPS